MKKSLALLLCLLALPVAHALGEPELLEPDQAFALSVQVRDAETLVASWKIADGYYLYRDKFKFESLDPGLILKPAIIPAGRKKNDPGFGVVETYVHAVTATLPIERRTSGAQTAKLRITAQGCNEPIGVCLSPVTKEVTLSLPALTTATADARTTGVKSLKDLAGLIEPRGSEDFLPPDQAFALATEVTDASTVTARIRIASGYYLYRDKTSVKLVSGDGTTLGTVELPRGQVKNDPYIGRTEIIHDELSVRIPLMRTKSAANDIALEIGYQGCAEKGICYPPQTKKVSLRLPAADAKPALVTAATKPPKIEGDSYLKLIFGAFFAGLLLTFTPCVLPMIPILSGVIVRSGDQTIGKLRGGLLSYSYVFGTAVTYTAAGVLAGLTGGQLQAYFQNPWAIGTFAAVLAFLALSMFGLFDLQMPSFIQSRLHYHTHKVKGGTFVGAFVLGLVSALIVGACVSPVLIGVLGEAIHQGDPVLGGSLMLALAHGQGVALVAVGIGAGFLLPKAGPWMDSVKQVFGVMLLGVAVYLLGFLPQVPVLLLWSALLIVTAVYLGATQSLPKEAGGWRYLWKGIGTFLLLWGVLALFGGLLGERDILKPVPLRGLAAFTAGAPATAANVPVAGGELFQRHANLSDIEQALAQAKRDGKPVVLDFYATWCTECVRMERSTFTDPRVRDALKRFVLLQADVTENNDASSALKRRFGVYGPPAMLFFAPGGEEKPDLRFYGYRNVEEYLALLGRV